MPHVQEGSGKGTPGFDTVVEGERIEPVRVAGDEPRATYIERYADDGEIGRGGMAEVRRVVDRNLQRPMAMKVLHEELATQPANVHAFLAEAQITAQLDHPNVPPVHELGVDPRGRRYFTMKLVEGRTLEEVAEALPLGDTSARLRQLLPVFLEVCDAVMFAHSARVVHRDIKPANVMVGRCGEVYVMDWGLARVMGARGHCDAGDGGDGSDGGHGRGDHGGHDAHVARVDDERHRHVAGTPAFMSPEQARGREHEIDERSDVFCLGGLLYFLATGEPPFAGADVGEVLEHARRAAIVPPEALNPSVPPALGRIIARAMSPDRAARHQSVAELRADVDRFRRAGLHLPVRTYPAGARIITEGELGDAAFIISRGTCVVYRTVGGECHYLRHLGVGEVFGEVAMLSPSPRSATVEAVDEVTVTVVSRELIDEALGQDSWVSALLRTIAVRFRELEDRLLRRG